MERSKRVLVIDDEAHIRRVVALKLKNKGFEVLTAKNGEEGLEIIRSQKPHAVVTDLNMPRLDGKALCEQSNPLKREWPFLTIVVTCRISPDETVWIERMQDTIFMEKPFSPKKIIEAIEKYDEAAG